MAPCDIVDGYAAQSGMGHTACPTFILTPTRWQGFLIDMKNCPNLHPDG